MGEAPAFFIDDLQRDFSNGFDDLKSNGCERTTSISVGGKTYLIGGNSTESTLSFGVRVFDQFTAEWVCPVVLGTLPNPGKGFSAVPVNEDRILIVKKGASTNDFAWFLEVDTPYVRQQRKILGTDVVAWSKGVSGNAPKPIVISGPSGVGKGTLISMLMKEFPFKFGFSVSHTTRAPRNREEDGVHYHFTDKSAMEKDIKEGKFLEFANVHGNLYGTSVEAVEAVTDAGRRCILDIDVQGARSVRNSHIEAVFIFVAPPSMDELEKRLRARGTETEEQILKRLGNAREEIEQGQSSGIFDHVVYNESLAECHKDIKKLLGLDNYFEIVIERAPKHVDLPTDHSISKLGQQIVISPINAELEKASKDEFVLELSSLKGGAPGRTRGFDMYVKNLFLDGLYGFSELS